MPTDLQLAWAAGFLDGEGCFGSYLQRGSSSARIVVSQSGSDSTLRVLTDIYGCGRIHRVKQSSPLSRLDKYSWSVSSAGEIQRVLDLTIPYLVAKRDQAMVLRRITHQMLSHKSTYGLGSTRGNPLSDEQRRDRMVLVEELKRLKRPACT